MKPKAKLLLQFSLEQCRDGIIFINNIPIFSGIESVAKQLQVAVWLDVVDKGNPKEYIR